MLCVSQAPSSSNPRWANSLHKWGQSCGALSATAGENEKTKRLILCFSWQSKSADKDLKWNPLCHCVSRQTLEESAAFSGIKFFYSFLSLNVFTDSSSKYGVDAVSLEARPLAFNAATVTLTPRLREKTDCRFFRPTDNFLEVLYTLHLLSSFQTKIFWVRVPLMVTMKRKQNILSTAW